MTETDEERIGKLNAIKLFDTRFLDNKPAGVFATLAEIHRFLFGEIYAFAGEIRTENIAKGYFRFASAQYLKPALDSIDAMPQSTFDEIIEKYVDQKRSAYSLEHCSPIPRGQRAQRANLARPYPQNRAETRR